MISKLSIICFLFFFISCTDSNGDYEVYVWKALYNSDKDPTEDYTVRTEIDTVFNNTPIQLDSIDTRFMLYQGFEALKIDSEPEILSIENDTLLIFGDMSRIIYFDEDLGILNVVFPHSRNPGSIRSYELQRRIKIIDGVEKEIDIKRKMTVVLKFKEEMAERFEELFKKQIKNIQQ